VSMLGKRLLAAGIAAGLALGSYGTATTIVLAAGPPHSPVLQPKPPTCGRGYVATQLIDPKTGKAVWKCLPKT
jgi:hypothetical protein